MRCINSDFNIAFSTSAAWQIGELSVNLAPRQCPRRTRAAGSGEQSLRLSQLRNDIQRSGSNFVSKRRPHSLLGARAKLQKTSSVDFPLIL
jgi:hypothetical protein